MPLVLASSSEFAGDARGRRVEHGAVAAGIDESAVKARLGDPAAVALELAKAKAAAVSAARRKTG